MMRVSRSWPSGQQSSFWSRFCENSCLQNANFARFSAIKDQPPQQCSADGTSCSSDSGSSSPPGGHWARVRQLHRDRIVNMGIGVRKMIWGSRRRQNYLRNLVSSDKYMLPKVCEHDNNEKSIIIRVGEK